MSEDRSKLLADLLRKVAQGLTEAGLEKAGAEVERGGNICEHFEGFPPDFRNVLDNIMDSGEDDRHTEALIILGVWVVKVQRELHRANTQGNRNQKVIRHLLIARDAMDQRLVSLETAKS